MVHCIHASYGQLKLKEACQLWLTIWSIINTSPAICMLKMDIKQLWDKCMQQGSGNRKKQHMNRLMTKPTKWHMRPVKTQISLGIRPVWSESLLCAQWVAKDSSFLHADSEDSDETGQTPRLIWVFGGRTCHFVGFVMSKLISSKVRLSQKQLTLEESTNYCVGIEDFHLLTKSFEKNMVFVHFFSVVIKFETHVSLDGQSNVNSDMDGRMDVYTVKILKICTPETFAVINLKFEQGGFTTE